MHSRSPAGSPWSSHSLLLLVMSLVCTRCWEHAVPPIACHGGVRNGFLAVSPSLSHNLPLPSMPTKHHETIYTTVFTNRVQVTYSLLSRGAISLEDLHHISCRFHHRKRSKQRGILVWVQPVQPRGCHSIELAYLAPPYVLLWDPWRNIIHRGQDEEIAQVVVANPQSDCPNPGCPDLSASTVGGWYRGFPTNDLHQHSMLRLCKGGLKVGCFKPMRMSALLSISAKAGWPHHPSPSFLRWDIPTYIPWRGTHPFTQCPPAISRSYANAIRSHDLIGSITQELFNLNYFRCLNSNFSMVYI